MSKNKRIAGLLVGLIAATSLSACAAEQMPAETLVQEDRLTTAETMAYETVAVEKGDYIKTGNGSASVIYLVKEDLAWDKSNTYYVETLVSKDDRVRAGDVLMRFEIKGSASEMQSLQLQIQRLREDMEAGKQERLEAMELHMEEMEDVGSYRRSIAKLELEGLQAEYDSFVFQKEQQILDLQTEIQELEADLAACELKAPFDGVIQSVNKLSEGDLVVPGQVQVSMYATDRVLLSAKDMGNLRYNMMVTIETGSKNEPVYLKGRVVAAPNVVPGDLQQPLTLIELVGSSEKLTNKIKYRCNAQEIEDVLVVDKDLIQKESGANYTYVLENGTVQKRYVSVALEKADEAWILDGLSEGQVMVIY